MKRHRYILLLILVAPTLAFSWLFVVATLPLEGGPNFQQFALVLGTLFGQVTLAAAWTALGPAPLLWRLPLSLTWLGVCIFAFAFNTAVYPPTGDSFFGLVFGACLVGQWLAVQVLLWGLVIPFGIKLRHWSQPLHSRGERRFGIRQMMIATAILAVAIGVCRWKVLEVTKDYQVFADLSGLALWPILTVVAVVFTVPLLLAALLPRYSWAAVGALLALTALATAWYEVPLVANLGYAPLIPLVLRINAVQAAWVLGVVAIVRISGYGVGLPQKASPDDN